ncbi:MAG: O-antigen ligase family protein [Sulfurimonas denitrificans]|nr:O-antigen ligase family protein [Sulfurimonas denitrificans]
MSKRVDFQDVLYYSALLFAFLLPLSRSASSFFLLLFFLLLLYKRDYKNTFETLKSSAIFTYIAIFLLYIFATLLWSEDIKEGINQIRLYGYWILLLPPLVVLVQKEWIWSMLSAFLLGMFVSEILAYGMFFDFWNINERDSSYPTPFMTHIHYSIYLAFTAILLLSRVFCKKLLLKEKLPYMLFFLLSTTNLMFSTGRAGQLAFFVALIVLIFLKYRITVKSVVMSFFSITVIFLLTYNSLELFKQRVDAGVKDVQNIAVQNYNNSFGIRVAFWLVAGEVLKEHSLLGNGIGDYKVSTKEILGKKEFGLSDETKEFMTTQHFHNQYLMVAVQGGFIGLTLMFLLFYKFFTLRIEDRELKEISVLGFVVIAVGSVAEPLWMLQFPLMLFLFITSISIIASKK